LEAQVVAKIMSFRNNLLVYKSLVESTARRNEGTLNLKLVSLQAENTALEHQIR
jgi:cell division protein FtsB